MVDKQSKNFLLEPSKQNLLASLFIILVSLIAFANSTFGEFVSDDYGLIIENADVKSLSNIPKLFVQSYWANQPYIGHYRPIPIVSFALDFAVNGLNPYGYHLTNIVLHILICLSIYWLCQKYTGKKLLSLFCASLFAAHPVHCEVVSVINGRAELLATLFLFVAWCCYLKSFEKNYWYVVSLVSYFLSLLSKETSFTFIGILMLVQICSKPTLLSKLLPNKKIIGYIVPTIIYLVLRVSITGVFGVPKGGQYFLPSDTFLTRVYTMSYGYLAYFRMLVWPAKLHLSYEHDFIATKTSLTLGVLGALFLVFLVIFVGFWQIRQRPIVAFGILFFFVASIVVSNIIVPTGHLIAERVVYLASLSVCLLGSLAIYFFYEKGLEKLAIGLFIFILVGLTVRAYYRNFDLQSNFAMANSVLSVSPSNVPANFTLAMHYESQDQLDKAEFYLKKSLELNPTYGSVQAALAHIYIKQARYDEAAIFLQQQVLITPQDTIPYILLGRLYNAKKDYEKSIEFYYKGINNYPVPYARLEDELANVLVSANRLKEAEEHFRKAIKLEPDFQESLLGLIKILQKQARHDETSELIKKTLILSPNNADAHAFYGVQLWAKKDLCEAQKELLKSLALGNTMADTHYYLGLVYFEINKIDFAKTEFQKALSLNPKMTEAKEKLILAIKNSNTEAKTLDCPS